MRNLFALLFSIVISVNLYSQIPTSCFEITSILVDGCAGSEEGKNEMVGLIIGPNPINVSDLSIDGIGSNDNLQTNSWPNNPFLGFCTTPQASANLQILNNAILQCGQLLEPVGGLLPAGAKVIIITSTEFMPIPSYFENLTETLYVIFQCAGNTAGHFVNYGSGTNNDRTLIINHLPSGCSDTVSYNRTMLLNSVGLPGAEDGGAVSYDYAGNANYFNNGCQAPFIPTEAIVNGQNNFLENAACIGGTINLTGVITGNYDSFSWSGGTGSFLSPNSLNTVYQLGAGDVGTVNLTLTVNAPCNIVLNTNYSFQVDQPFLQDLSINPQGDIYLCDNQSQIVSASGGSGSYLWSNDSTTSSISVNQSGLYYVLSVNACQMDSIAFNVFSGTAPILTQQSTLPNCVGDCNASASVIASGGSGIYTYLWSSNAGSSISSSVSDLCAGTYTCTVTDSGCSDDITIVIQNPNPISSSNIIVNESCNNACDASINITPNGGTAPYIINVTNESGTIISDLTNLCSGNYLINIIDAFACESTEQNVLINTINPIDYTKSNNQTICKGDSINLIIDFIQGNPSILWENGQNNDSIYVNPSFNEIFTFTLTNGGCSTQDSILVIVNDCTIPDSSELVLPNFFSPNNDGDNDEYKPLKIKSVQIESFIIVNRWGNIIKEFNDNNINWDGKDKSGKEVTEGTFFYIANYKNSIGEKNQVHGYIQLVRN